MKRTIEVATSAIVALSLLMGMMTGVAAASQPKLSSELLRLSQMPVGWIIDSSERSSHNCLGSFLAPKGVRQTASANILLDDSGGTPYVDETLATYRNARDAYKTITSTVMKCDANGKTITLARMNFPQFGNSSAAFVLTTQGWGYAADFLVVRKNNVLLGIEYVDLNPIYTPWFHGFIVKALRNLSAS